MQRLGKTQEFTRNFTFLSTLGFVSIYMATWEFVLVSLSVGLSNGGFAGLFWCFITTILAYATIVASLAEMESMAPTSGGQYHWVSEFAPPRYQRVLSYASGWMSTLGWLAAVASSCYVSTTQIQTMVQVTRAEYAFSPWQYTLTMIAVVLVTIVFNTFGAKVLPMLETVSLFGHGAGFVFVIVALLVLCPKNSAYEVFVDFQANGGWSPAPAYLISQVTILYCNFGSDSVVHISEEVPDASIIVPKAMWWSYVGNVALGIVMLITMLFCIGPLEPVINSDAPYLILFNNTGSPALSIVLNVVLFLLIFLGNITALATCAREMWAFARDKGLPFYGWLGAMDSKWNVPFNTVYATSLACIVLALIQLGSTVAFNIVVSLSTLGLLSTYMISIGGVFLKRLRSEPLPPARWSLGRYGIYINGFAFFYAAFVLVFCCFPSYLPVTTGNANWAPAVWAAVIVISVVYYLGLGTRQYTAPVEFVEGRKVDGVGLQST
ncbi:amino acid transporter [Teratosphaeria nubilosa]|uniref:Amino acid transporter n=1 Tax=Teratosphaeria nubilosa TaxID=161662 RepID=A0A6G1LC16_9PEZI|nr:amino acid transporter [Teratosphaeria nubilosa]